MYVAANATTEGGGGACFGNKMRCFAFYADMCGDVFLFFASTLVVPPNMNGTGFRVSFASCLGFLSVEPIYRFDEVAC